MSDPDVTPYRPLPVVQAQSSPPEAAFCPWCRWPSSGGVFCKKPPETAKVWTPQGWKRPEQRNVACEDKNPTGHCEDYKPTMLTRLLRRFGFRRPYPQPVPVSERDECNILIRSDVRAGKRSC